MGSEVSHAIREAAVETPPARARRPVATIPTSGGLDLAGAVALQRSAGNRAVVRLLTRDVTVTVGPLPDGITCNSCTPDQAAQIGAAHERGKLLARNAIAKLITYHGGGGEVHDALTRNFHDASEDTAQDVAAALRYVIGEVHGTTYLGKSTPNGSTEAMALWCLPWSDIRVYPLFYANTSVNYRGSTLLHEWMHRYHCDLDLGYAWEKDYQSHGRRRQLWNADAYSTLAYEIGQPDVGDFDAPPSSDSGAA